MLFRSGLCRSTGCAAAVDRDCKLCASRAALPAPCRARAAIRTSRLGASAASTERYITDSTRPHELHEHLLTRPRSAYVGFDPTAPSLQVGNLVPVMLLAHLQRAGGRPIVVMGGGTGLIGDPRMSGERVLNDRDTVEAPRRLGVDPDFARQMG